MIRNKTLLFSIGCFGLFSIFSLSARDDFRYLRDLQFLDWSSDKIA